MPAPQIRPSTVGTIEIVDCHWLGRPPWKSWKSSFSLCKSFLPNFLDLVRDRRFENSLHHILPFSPLLYFCCNIHDGRDALNYFRSRQVTEFSQQSAILNPARSDFNYPSDFGFLKDSVGFGCGIGHIPRTVARAEQASLLVDYLYDRCSPLTKWYFCKLELKVGVISSRKPELIFS